MSDWCSCNPLREAQEKAKKWDAIVRCGDCKYYFDRWESCMRNSYTRTFYEPDGGWGENEEGFFGVEPDGFCSWGERIER